MNLAHSLVFRRRCTFSSASEQRAFPLGGSVPHKQRVSLTLKSCKRILIWCIIFLLLVLNLLCFRLFKKTIAPQEAI